jgi:hypothetical protein
VPQQLSPAVAIGAIAILGVMLLLGVLIGNDNDDQTTTVSGAAAAPVATTATPTTPTATTPTAAAPAKDAGAAAAAGAGAGSGNVEQGGSGSTEGISAADTGKSPQENAKGGPDQVATQGNPAELDPEGEAGGGSGSTCIGC